jgi:hypothetical protein
MWIGKDDLDSHRIMQYVSADLSHDYYVSDDFSVDFYVTQAVNGFIAVAYKDEYILPQLQTSYCILDWDSLEGHNNRLLRKLRNDPKYSNLKISINEGPHSVVEWIHEHHGHKSWLSVKYRNLLYELFSLGTIQHDDGIDFTMITVSVHDGTERILAGEIGYVIGSVYTCITGYSDRQIAGVGTLQILATSKILKKLNFDFLNFGQPPQNGLMVYKEQIGGREVPRGEFLARWEISIQKKNLKMIEFLKINQNIMELLLN